MVNLQQAIKDCQNGRSDAFGVIYDQFVKKIYNYLYFRTGHKETAEDLTSVAFTKAYEHINSFNAGQGTFQAWIYRIARNTLIDHYRTSKATLDISAVLEIKSRTDLEAEFDTKRQLEQAVEYFTTLPEPQREVLTMRLWDGLSYQEIAAITGKSEASLKMSVSRTLAKFKAQAVMAAVLFLISN